MTRNMKQISIEIPDTQVAFMIELLKKLKFVKINESPVDSGFALTETQINSIEAERAKSKKNPDYLLDWDSVKDSLKVH